MSASKINWKHMIFAFFVVLLVFLSIFLVLNSQRITSRQDSPTSTLAPDGEDSYWNKQRMESASPAPMPS